LSTQIPFIYLFQSLHRYYFYDVNKNCIIEIGSEFYEELTDITLGNSIEELNSSKFMEYRKQGFLSSNRALKVDHPLLEYIDFYISNKIQKLTLQLTQECNLRCAYCVYGGRYNNRKHSKKTMSFEIAKKAIDFVVSRSKDSKKLNFGFYGGEPLLEFELLRQCVDYIKVSTKGKKLTLSVTTNGTLLNSENVKFLAENNIQLAISLDGPQKVHDVNRKYKSNGCGSFMSIMSNIEELKKEYPAYSDQISFSTVIDPRNDLTCSNEFFLNYKTVKDIPNFATGIAPVNLKRGMKLSPDYEEKLGYEEFKLLLNKLDKLECDYISHFTNNFFSTHEAKARVLKSEENIPETIHPGGPCVPGVLRLFVDVNGVFFPCERVSEASKVMRIGNVVDGFEVDKVKRLLNIGKISEKKCLNCWAYRFCDICAAQLDDGSSTVELGKQKECDRVIDSTIEFFKDYCFLKHYGYSFQSKRRVR
jgi:uncharacterized protein